MGGMNMSELNTEMTQELLPRARKSVINPKVAVYGIGLGSTYAVKTVDFAGVNLFMNLTQQPEMHSQK
jgi:hypothetical protein